MSEGYYLIAHVMNAQSLTSAEVEWEVASQSINGSWFTNSGHEVWPFHTIPISDPAPAIPDGWIEHLHSEAIAYATRTTPTASLTERLGIGKTPPRPIDRRI